ARPWLRRRPGLCARPRAPHGSGARLYLRPTSRHKALSSRSSGGSRVADAFGAVLIAGPTAAGKSALALALARRLGGTVVNADSMQVYGDLRTLTARPSAADEALAPHRLYGHVDGAVNYSVGRYVTDAA